METGQPQVSRNGNNPFPWWIVDGLLDADTTINALNAVPPATWQHWVRYRNDCERDKRTCNDRAYLPNKICCLLAMLETDVVVGFLRRITGIMDLVADKQLYGAGLQVMEPGGWLQAHGDYQLHPQQPGMERRLSLILCLNLEWDEAWGGQLLLCDAMGKPVQELTPRFNSVMIFESNSTSWHGVRQIKGPTPRITAASYYLAPARPTAHRQRAMYMPNRNGGECPKEVQ